MKDNWCEPYKFKGRLIYGGAARNARIKQGGGMDNILLRVAHEAAQNALERANEMQQERSSKLKLVK